MTCVAAVTLLDQSTKKNNPFLKTMVLDKKKTQSQSVSQCSQHFSNSFHPKGCVHLEVQVVREIRTVAELAPGQKSKIGRRRKSKTCFRKQGASMSLELVCFCHHSYMLHSNWIMFNLLHA